MPLQPSRLLILVLGALTAFAPISIDMYLPSFPTLERAFEARASDVQLTLSTFFLGLAIGQVIYGPVADRFGRRPPLFFGIALYILASLGCVFATSIEALILFRFLQAFGGCAGMVISRAMVRDLFDEKGSARMFARLMAIMGAAPILAPLLGGQLLLFADWRAIFWVLVVFGFLCLAGVTFVLKETLAIERRRSLHPVSVLATYLRLFADRYFMGHVLGQSLTFASMFAYLTASPFVFISLYGVPAERFGWIFGGNALGFILASQVNLFLLKWTTPGRILSVGLLVTLAAGLLPAITTATGFGGLPGILVPQFFFLVSLGFIGPNAMARALAPQGANAGSASALIGTMQFGIAAATGAIVAALPNTSAMPMTAAMAVAAILGNLAYRILVGSR
ncbi:MAG: Bcr/CflA family multidrug efflux MFS transporter [Alphaproteobacteria bacterium]|nr:Bcr/CflA family multidrug efflux MFS transporter [Alphaproteobacteria bacterium]